MKTPIAFEAKNTGKTPATLEAETTVKQRGDSGDREPEKRDGKCIEMLRFGP